MKNRIIKKLPLLFAVLLASALTVSLKAGALKYDGGFYIWADAYTFDEDINGHLYLSLDGTNSFYVKSVLKNGCYPSGTCVYEKKNGEQTDEKFIYILTGDVNCDGVVDVLDVITFETCVSGEGEFDFIESASADFDRDGEVEIEDYSQLVNLSLSGEDFYDGIVKEKKINTVSYSQNQINSDKTLFAVGKTEPAYVTAKFNSDFTSVTISANGTFSDGKIADYGSKVKSVLTLHAATLKNAVIENGITYIGDRFFADCVNLKSITLPPTCRETGTRAFSNNCAAETLDLGRVKIIGRYSFADCCGVTGALNIPDSCVFIGDYAFSAINSGNMNFSAVTVGKNTEYIGAGAFQLCTKANNELVLPEKLKVIGDFAFNHCNSFCNTVLKIPAGVTHIGGNSVCHPLRKNENTGLQNITYKNYKTAKYLNSGTHVFYAFGSNKFKSFEVAEGNTCFKAEDGVLYSNNMKRLVCVPKNHGAAYIMPEGVKTADEMSMADVTDLTLANTFDIITWDKAPATQINFQNTLTDALYINALNAVVHLKLGNAKYVSLGGGIYSRKDGYTLLQAHIEPGGSFDVVNGCQAIDGAFLHDSRIGARLGTCTLNIPASVTSISNNFSQTYPDEGELDGINRYISEGVFKVNIDSKNPRYKTDKNGQIVLK